MNFTASNNIGLFHTTCCKSTLENTEEIIQNGQSRETGNLGYTRRRKMKEKTKTQHNMCWTPLYDKKTKKLEIIKYVLT